MSRSRRTTTSAAARRLSAVAAGVALALAAVPGAVAQEAAGPAGVPRAATCETFDVDSPDATTGRPFYEAADAVFVGEVRQITEVQPPQQGDTDTPKPGSQQTDQDTRRRSISEVEVVATFKGTVPSPTVLVGTDDNPLDGLMLQTGRQYLFFAADAKDAPGADVTVTGCDGTVALQGTLDAPTQRTLNQFFAEFDRTEQPAPAVEFAEPADGRPGEPDLTRLLAPGGALVLVGLLGLLLIAGLGRRTSA